MKLERPTLDEKRFRVKPSGEHYIVTCLYCRGWQRLIGQRPADRFVAEHDHGPRPAPEFVHAHR